MANVVVLAGGDSDEREISLLSGAAVAKALQTAGHVAVVVDPRDGLEEQLAVMPTVEVVFPALHGKNGEDGVIQRILEEHGIPFVGSSSVASELCFDKDTYTALLNKHNIDVPQTKLVDKISLQHSDLIKLPFVLKPNDGGSSIDTFIMRDVSNVDFNQFDDAFDRHGNLLLQELISGVEITAAILGKAPLTVVEIIPPADGEFDYENKYNGQTQELCPPQNVSTDMQLAAQLLAKTIHELTNCRDISRTDIIITSDQKLYVLETNTIPGLTEESLLPRAAAQAHLSMPQLCDQLVRDALARA